MTDHRWTSLFRTALALVLIAALPAAAAPASTPPAEPDLAASYAAIFSPAPAETVPAAAPVSWAEPATETGFAIVYCCSATYCCEAMMSSECDGIGFGSIFNCATRCSLC